ncbi:ABC transporter permease [Pseudonocardia alni]|uniref:ABC transporter permease n=1 Tax=Pseudonocardia alni TaxID=33907 RepID=UPI0033CF893E
MPLPDTASAPVSTAPVGGPVRPPAGGARRRAVGRLVVPALVVVAVVLAYPVLMIFIRSVVEVPPGAGPLDNYLWYFSEPTEMVILRRTFVVGLWVTGIALAVGFPYAYLMTVVGPRTRLLMLGAVMLPFWSNLVVRTYAWVILLQDTGPVPAALRALGFGDIRFVGTTLGMTIATTQVLMPFLVLPLFSTLSRIDRRLLDAARSLGARPVTAFVRVYLPLAVPGILAGSMLVFILSLGFYFTPALLGGTGNSLVSQQIVLQVSRLLNFGRGGAMALVLLALTLLLLAVAALATRRSTRALGIGETR